MSRECGDKELAARATAGDREAMAGLLEAYYERIYRMAWRWCGSAGVAEDIAQDVCVKLATSIRSYRGDSTFPTWVWRITYNATIDHLRIEQRLCATEPTKMMALVDRPANDTPETWLFEDDLWREVHGLPPQQRDDVLLVYSQDMSHAHAASIM